MDDTEKRPDVEHTSLCLPAASGVALDLTLLNNLVADGWAIGSAYGVTHPTQNSILHYFVLHRRVAPANEEPKSVEAAAPAAPAKAPEAPKGKGRR